MYYNILNAEVFLDHISIESTNPKRIAQFYSKNMMMDKIHISKNEWHCIGSNRLLIFQKGVNNKLSFTAFGCKSQLKLKKIKERILLKNIEIKEFNSIYLKKGSFFIYDPDNNKIVFGVPMKRNFKKIGYHAPLQHLTLQSLDVKKIVNFYHEKLGFAISDRVIDKNGEMMTCFLRSNKEHHNIACF